MRRIWRHIRKLWRLLNMADTFDRIEFEQEVKECFDPKILYDKSEQLSRLRLKSHITSLEYTESMEVVLNQLKQLGSVKNAIKGAQ